MTSGLTTVDGSRLTTHDSMKAVFFQKHGGNEVLEYGDRPLPEPGAGEVRVAIRAAALNHLDIFVRDGIPGVPLPQIPGADGAGVVDAVGAGVEGLSAGDRVLIQPGLYDNACEFCRAGEQSLCVRYRILGEHVPGTFAERSSFRRAMSSRSPSGSPSSRRPPFRSCTRRPGEWSSREGDLRPGRDGFDSRSGGRGRWRRARDREPLAGARVFRDDIRAGEGEAPGGGRVPKS